MSKLRQMQALATMVLGFTLAPSATAEAPMSPAVKAHLCTLAKRDAAIAPAKIEQHEEERAECLASMPPR
jgi:hypothetical protein